MGFVGGLRNVGRPAKSIRPALLLLFMMTLGARPALAFAPVADCFGALVNWINTFRGVRESQARVKPGPSFFVLEPVPDPMVPNGKLNRIRPRISWESIDTEETGHLKAFLEKYPLFGAKLGFVLGEDGTLTYPSVAGINARILDLRLKNDFAAPHFLVWSDTSLRGAGLWQFLRYFSVGLVPLSEHGVTEYGVLLHYHDLLVHLFGYLMLPGDTAAQIKDRIAALVALHDSPQLKENKALRRRIADLAEEATRTGLEVSTAAFVRLPLMDDVPIALLAGEIIGLTRGMDLLHKEVCSEIELTPLESQTIDEIFSVYPKRFPISAFSEGRDLLARISLDLSAPIPD